MKNFLRKSICIVLVFALIMTGLMVGVMPAPKVLAAGDEPQIVYDDPVTHADANTDVTISFEVSDDSESVTASVYHKLESESEYTVTEAVYEEGEYNCTLSIGTDDVEYYIKAVDEEGNSDESDTYTIIVNKVYEDREEILSLIGRFTAQGETEEDRGVAEIVKYDRNTKKAFVVNGADDAVSVDIIDLSGLASDSEDVQDLSLSHKIRINDIIIGEGFTAGDITSVDVHPDGGYFAVSLPNSTKTDSGRVAFFAIDANYTYLGSVEVGALPDNLVFTPDGNTLLVANEGEPDVVDGDYLDPVGSVSIIDVSDGIENISQDDVDTAVFDDSLIIDEGVIIKNGSTTANDFEPEYITVESDSRTAYVSLQENNAIAKLDIEEGAFTHVYALGFKDFSLSGLDGSNKDDIINIRKWPVLGAYMPDGIEAATINGRTYIFSANEGDAREYGEEDEEGYYTNEIAIEDIEDNLDLKIENYGGYSSQEEFDTVTNTVYKDENLGKLKVQSELGLNDESEYEAVYTFGARSFSIWDADTMTQVYDSGADFEKITAERLPDYFNCDNESVEMDDRSDNKGPEPEDVKVGKVGSKYYAFIGLERIGGILVYDVTDPASPSFAQYINTRDFSEDVAGDVAPEGLKFVPASESPTQKPLLLVANEVSGTLSVFQVKDDLNARIAVFSDPHYFASDLGTEGAAFEAYLAQDRKLIAESSAITEATVDAIKASNAEIVLVAGDLTKDGELESHQQFAELLGELEQAGKKVYVICGNHDINNPEAYSYNGATVTRVDNVTPEGFKTIYSDFGYGEAIEQDPDSLSYVVEPVEGLRIIAMDSCIYGSNNDLEHSVTDGEFSEERLDWIKKQIKMARAEGKMVVGMMHQGLIEHFSVQEEMFDEYVIEDWEDVSDELADLGMHIVFTGHFHAQDIVKKTTENGNTIYDIETGSLVTYPIPYRMVTISGNTMDITTNKIEEIDYDIGDAENFQSYAKEYLIEGLDGLVPYMLAGILQAQQPGLSEADAYTMALGLASTSLTPTLTVQDLIVNAMVAHYQGDEVLDATTQAILVGMTASSDANTKMLANSLLSILTDPMPADNNVTLDITSSNSLLKNIYVNGKAVSGLDADKTSYTVNVGNSTKSAVIRAVLADEDAGLSINGQEAASGEDFGPVNLSVGSNSVTIAVTPENGAGPRAYTLNIIRARKGSSGNDNESPSDTTPEEQPDTNTGTAEEPREPGAIKVNAPTPVMDDSGRAVAQVDRETMQQAINDAGNAEGATIEIEVPRVEGANTVTVKLPAEALASAREAKVQMIQINTEFASIAITPDAFGDASAAGGSEIALSVEKVSTEELPEDIRKEVGNAPVYDFNAFVGETQVHRFNGGEKVKVTVNYELKPGEDPDKIVVYYINDEGRLEVVNDCIYDAATGKVTFETDHFSKYAVKQSKVTFSDIAGVAWAKSSIEALAAREIIDGVGADRFEPDGKVTREAFVKMLVKGLGLVDETAACSFKDVSADAWYYIFVASAQKLGIINGLGDGTFGVGKEITRQEMAVMAYRAAKIAGIEFKKGTAGVEFADKSEIAGYAGEAIGYKQKAVIINSVGGNRYAPNDSTTRASAAKVIFELYKLANE